MSLHVYLQDEPRSHKCTCPECGDEHATVRAVDLFSANITHNLTHMAEAAGVYDHIWRPEETGVRRADQLIAPLRGGLERLRAEPDRFKAMDAANGWGRYVDFLPWLEEYIAACERFPEALVRVSR